MSLKSWFQWKGQIIIGSLFSKILWPPSSSFALVEKEDKILALSNGDYFMPPGGTLKYGESFEECVKRETLEETGYNISLTDRITEQNNSVGGIEVGFKAEVVKKEKDKTSWEGQTQWIEKDKIKNKVWRFNRDLSQYL